MLHDRFKLTRSEDVSHFLSFDITQNCDRKTFTMNQSSYVRDLVEIHNSGNTRPVSTPCDNHFQDLKKNNDPLLNTSHPYCSSVGALLWLSNGTRPDITFTLNCLSSFMNNPTDIHWKAAIRVLTYVRDTPEYSITLGGNDLTLTGHSDSDWAEQREDRRSTTGFVFCLRESPVSWKSRRQPTIALSSVEDERMALTDSAREAIWWRNIMHELCSIDLHSLTIIDYDNKGAGELALDPCHQSRSTHIDVKHHFICECISNALVKLNRVPTLSTIADILTKPLKVVKHMSNVKLLFQA